MRRRSRAVRRESACACSPSCCSSALARNALGAAALAATLAIAAPKAAAAQVDTAAHRAPTAPKPAVVIDTVGHDTTARDTTRRDTTADSIPVQLPAFDPEAPRGPLPAGSRYVFTADSLEFSDIRTLGDLLAHIPGVYVVRGGFFGQAEIALFGGRGPLSLELYWDGVPYQPLGHDSVYVDVGRVPLPLVGRVEVVLLPASLHIYLTSIRTNSTQPATEVGVFTGQQSIARYRALYAKRWRSGVGLSLIADWNNEGGDAGTSTTSFHDVNLWLEGEYTPTPRFGVAYEIVSTTWSRDSLAAVVTGLQAKRQDGMFRVFAAHSDDGLGPRAELTIASASTSQDKTVPDRSQWQDQLTLSNSWPHAHADLTARLASDPRPFTLEATGAWNPVSYLTLDGDARHAVYDSSRAGDRIHMGAGLALPWGFSLRGDATETSDLAAPALAKSRRNDMRDLGGAVRWDTRWWTLEAGGGRRDAFFPDSGFAAGIRTVGGIGPTPFTQYVTANGSLRPLPGVELSGWYFEPRAPGGGDFEPPTHARLSAAFYSKFWRVYKSGIFALRAEFAAESWSRGFGGLDSSGAQLVLPGATFGSWNVQMRIAGVTIMWYFMNANSMKLGYAHGLGYPRLLQYYGVRWAFKG